MNGPEIGKLSYSQPGGNLLIKIKLEFGQPNTAYRVFLVCGPAHNASCGFTNIGALATNAAGAGSVNITVPLGVLEAPPFGPGFRNDHVDLLRAVGDLSKGGLTAGAINYFVCKRREKAPASKIPAGMADVQAGDPLSSKQGTSKAKSGGKKS
jgi:hypothetical protein